MNVFQYFAHLLVSKNLFLCSFTTKYTISEMSIWDGASYHRSNKVKKFLLGVNDRHQPDARTDTHGLANANSSSYTEGTVRHL